MTAPAPASGLVCGDCAKVMAGLPADSVDLVVTSPPYAQQRAGIYEGGAQPDRYSEWFMPIASQIRRVLKPTGSFVLNIKENVVDGEKSTYVMNLVMAMRSEAGFRWVDDYVWVKTNTFPGKWPNRFRDSWEHLHHFTINKKFKMNQDAVMVPTSHWQVERSRRLSAKDHHDTTQSSGLVAPCHAKFVGRDKAYPSNVLRFKTNNLKLNHPAPYPPSIPDFFIRLFTDAGDMVLDPFVGSGTTALAAARLGRRWIGIDISPEYIDIARRRVDKYAAQERLTAP